jgi:alpha-beta hydrolase superfamily lysophospholipase
VAPWKGLDWLEPGVKIGEGFQEVWDDTAQRVLDEVRKAKDRHPEASISTTGHSLGGSTALLSALHLNHNLNAPVKVIVFGMPRTGNKKVRLSPPPLP